MEPLRPEDRLMRAAGSSRRCIGKDVRLRDRGSDAVSVEARAAAARAAVGGGGSSQIHYLYRLLLSISGLSWWLRR